MKEVFRSLFGTPFLLFLVNKLIKIWIFKNIYHQWLDTIIVLKHNLFQLALLTHLFQRWQFLKIFLHEIDKCYLEEFKQQEFWREKLCSVLILWAFQKRNTRYWRVNTSVLSAFSSCTAFVVFDFLHPNAMFKRTTWELRCIKCDLKI